VVEAKWYWLVYGLAFDAHCVLENALHWHYVAQVWMNFGDVLPRFGV
jgi:hypothetical protein